MNKDCAQILPHQKNSSAEEVSMTQTPLGRILTQEEIYERKIFDLQAQIENLEYHLMMTEAERDRYKRQACA